MKILLAGEIAEWKTLETSRCNQAFRNQLAQDLRIIADRISNCQQDSGAIGSIRWRLEPTPIAKSVDDEAA